MACVELNWLLGDDRHLLVGTKRCRESESGLAQRAGNFGHGRPRLSVQVDDGRVSAVRDEPATKTRG